MAYSLESIQFVTESICPQNDAGVTFIGPGSEPIKSMGDKIASKRIAKAAGVNMIPGYDGEVADEDEAVKISNDIGE